MSSTTKSSTLRVIIAVSMIIAICAGTVLIIVDLTPGASGLPADISAIQE